MFYSVRVSQNRLTSRILYDWLFLEYGGLTPLLKSADESAHSKVFL
jgi:hypothetical protein